MRKSVTNGLRGFATLLFALLAVGRPTATQSPAAEDFHAWAAVPPMGWNSWDAFGTTVTEAQTRTQAEFMARQLKSHGWHYVVVDIQWYEGGAEGHEYRPGAPLTMDGFGRLMPAVNKFPSAANGAGFRPLAEYIHGLGLKFGIHLMRGIPRQAVEKRLPVKGAAGVVTADVADRNSTCPWNPDMYGVDMSKPGAQAYYDSVFDLIASWGVDYVKIDDIARPYHRDEVEAIRHAIDRTGRAMVLSLSPGETPLAAGPHVQQHANLWRISDDFWDRWLALREQFPRLERWNQYRIDGAWPDADMLPLGVLGTRNTRFTPDEQTTLMTLWAIARSPLMHGGDMTKTDAATLALLTNDEVLAVNQRSTHNRPLFNRDELIAWTADVPGSRDRYLAVFNARDRVRLTPDHALYRSPLVTGDPSSAVRIDVDVTGGTRLYLFVDPTEDGVEGDRAIWLEPTLTFADGHTEHVTDREWTQADALWDNASTERTARAQPLSWRGQPVAFGIRTLAASKIEYALPPGVTRFTATGAIDPDGNSNRGGTVRFVVGMATPETDRLPATVRVPVSLADLRLAGPVTVRDLWTHRDVGEVTGEFAPEVPFHGARLFRLSPW